MIFSKKLYLFSLPSLDSKFLFVSTGFFIDNVEDDIPIGIVGTIEGDFVVVVNSSC